MPWDPAYRKQGVHGVTANAIDVVVETGDSGPVTPIGINLPNDQDIRERHGSKSVLALERHRGVRQVDAARLPQRVLVDAGGGRARRAVEPRSPSELTHQHARGDRPRIGAHRGAARREPAGRACGSTSRRSRRRAPTSVALYFLRRPEAGRARARAGGRPRRHRAGRVRGVRAQRARAAAADPRGHARSKKTTCATAR